MFCLTDQFQITFPIRLFLSSDLRHFPLLPTINFSHAVRVRHSDISSPNIDIDWISILTFVSWNCTNIVLLLAKAHQTLITIPRSVAHNLRQYHVQMSLSASCIQYSFLVEGEGSVVSFGQRTLGLLRPTSSELRWIALGPQFLQPLQFFLR